MPPAELRGPSLTRDLACGLDPPFCFSTPSFSFEEVTLFQPDFVSCSFHALARIVSDAAANNAQEGAVFRAAWKWGTAELPHMQFLPEILRVRSR